MFMHHLKRDEEPNFWMSYTDLMSGFLIVFILITAILFINYRSEHNLGPDNAGSNDLRNIIDQYETILHSTETINVQADKNIGSIILTHKQYDLFEPGSWYIQGDLADYLVKYGPQLIRKTISISSNIHRAVELRIEGHTDPTWLSQRGTDISFMNNLTLSSKRANSVYEFLFNLKDENDVSIWKKEEIDFIKKNMISVGYSFSRRLIDNNVDNVELDDKSRRIEFRIIAK